MLTRIVKMEFEADKVPSFLANFEKVKEQIRYFPGCTHLKLLQDQSDPTVFFTYSRWESGADVEAYRKSALFGAVWATTKTGFRSKPQAWSVDVLHNVDA